MLENLLEIRSECKKRIEDCKDSKALYELKVEFLGKSGSLTALLRSLKDVPEDKRPMAGKQVNEVREFLEGEFLKKDESLKNLELTKRLNSQSVDITYNKRPVNVGKLTPINMIKKRAVDFFVSLGFFVDESPEIETVYYNFDALNTPKDHPSRDSQDTFFLSKSLLLRSQTSTGQIRTMEKTKPPIKMISPGRVYRSDEVDATHSPCFHQLEGLVVDKNVTMCDLKGVLSAFAKSFFDKDTKIRFRPSFFPFTEPSVEVDVTCCACKGAGCRVCKGLGMIEILGAGMVNRNVLSGVGINPDEYSGFAFGMGLDRITAIIHGINDARIPFEGDIRFLKQF